MSAVDARRRGSRRLEALAELGAAPVAAGLWRWTAWHREWEQRVGSLAIGGARGLVLVDPLVPDGETAWRALDDAVGQRPVDVVLTVHYHRRSADRIAGRYPGVRVWAERSGVRRLAGLPVERPFRPSDGLPGGLVAWPTARSDEVVLWLPASAAVIAGDVLLGGKTRPLRLCPAHWLPDGVGRPALALSLASLLWLPVERVLVSHGEPVLENAASALRVAIETWLGCRAEPDRAV